MDAQDTVDNLREHWPIVIGSLVNVARESGMVDVPSFAFAVTEQSISDVTVDGRTQEVPGLKLDLYPISADRMGETGWAYARPIWLDESFRAVWFEGAPVFAELWILSYQLPADLSAPLRLGPGGLDPEFVGLDRAVAPFDEEVVDGTDGREVDGTNGWEAWDWVAAEFVPVDIDSELDAARIVAPSGEVLLRVSTARLGVSPLTAVLTWGDAP